MKLAVLSRCRVIEPEVRSCIGEAVSVDREGDGRGGPHDSRRPGGAKASEGADSGVRLRRGVSTWGLTPIAVLIRHARLGYTQPVPAIMPACPVTARGLGPSAAVVRR